jgi:hypothetical protein
MSVTPPIPTLPPKPSLLAPPVPLVPTGEVEPLEQDAHNSAMAKVVVLE